MLQYSIKIILFLTLLVNFSSKAQVISSDIKSFRITSGKIEITIISPQTRGFKPSDNSNKYPIINEKKLEVKVTIKGGHGELKVKINDIIAKKSSQSEYSASITLFSGENIIKILVVDDKGNSASSEFKVIGTYQYEIKVENGQYFALLIGINNYNDEAITDLQGPLTDIKKLKEILKNNYTFEDENISILENPTRKEMLSGFELITDKLSSKDNLLIFFAGHGIWDKKREIGYWLPSDAEANNTDKWFMNSTVKDYISSNKSKHTLLITDACFSGSIFKTRSGSGTSLLGYNKLYELQSRKGMTSGTLEEVPDKSIFIEYLLKRLEQNEDKYLPAFKLFNSLRDAVLDNSPNVPQYGTIQGASDEGGEFIFIKN